MSYCCELSPRQDLYYIRLTTKEGSKYTTSDLVVILSQKPSINSNFVQYTHPGSPTFITKILTKSLEDPCVSGVGEG